MSAGSTIVRVTRGSRRMLRSLGLPVTVLKTGVSPSSKIQTGVTWAEPSSLTRPSIPSAFLSKSAFVRSLIVIPGLYSDVARAPEEIALGRHQPRLRAGVRGLECHAAQHC